MNEILSYVSGYRRSADVCYRLPDGRKEKLYRKLDGSDREAIQGAVNELKDRGVKTIIVDVYKPNGTSKVFDRSFTISNARQVNRPSRSKPLSGPTPQRGTLQHVETPLPMTSKIQPMENWKDYALQTEREKVAKLEAENLRLKAENKTLDEKVRDFEKEMIRKEHDLQNLSKTVESKSGLNGFVDKATESPAIMNMLTGLASRMLGLPPEPNAPVLQGSPELINPKADQYLTNIRTWLLKQPEDLQDNFYSLVFELTNAKDVSSTIQKLLNLFRNGTTMPTNQSKAAS